MSLHVRLPGQDKHLQGLGAPVPAGWRSFRFIRWGCGSRDRHEQDADQDRREQTALKIHAHTPNVYETAEHLRQISNPTYHGGRGVPRGDIPHGNRISGTLCNKRVTPRIARFSHHELSHHNSSIIHSPWKTRTTEAAPVKSSPRVQDAGLFKGHVAFTRSALRMTHTSSILQLVPTEDRGNESSRTCGSSMGPCVEMSSERRLLNDLGPGCLILASLSGHAGSIFSESHSLPASFLTARVWCCVLFSCINGTSTIFSC